MTKITITKQVKEGESVSIQATPATKDYDFDSYSGSINGTITGGRTQENGNNPLAFNAATNSNITANFKGTNEGRIEIRWYNSVNEPGYGPITRTSASLNATNLRGVQRISDYGNAINVNGTLNSGRWTGYYEGTITGFPISAIKYVGFIEEGGTYPGSSRSNVYYADFRACTSMTQFGNRSNNQQFYYHNTIETVKLPSSIESIYFTAFAGSNIKTLYIYATTPPSISGSQYSSGDIIFSGCSNLRRIYVPAGSVNAYKSATAWSYYSDKITAIIDVKSEVNPVNSGKVVSKAASETSELSNTQSSTLDGLILTASENSGYSFSSWKRGTTVLSSSNPYTLYSPDNINGTDTIIAEFLPTYTISATVDPVAYGTVSGTGSYLVGSTCTLTFTPESGYMLKNWTESGTSVSTDNPYTFTVSGNRTLVCNAMVRTNPLVVKTNGAGSIKLKNTSNQVYTLNLENGTNNYYGTEPGFELNNLKSIYKSEGNNVNNTYITEVNISHTSITEIPDYAFKNCKALTFIYPSDYLTRIGNYAFQGCTSWAYSLYLPSSLQTIGSYAFADSNAKGQLTCTSALQSIGTAAFKNSAITEVAFNTCTALTTIPNEAFKGCTSLTKINISKVRYINQSAFEGCTSLTSITFNTNTSTPLTEINEKAFYGCTSLSSFTIPSNGSYLTKVWRSSFLDTAWWNNQAAGIVYKQNICFGPKSDPMTYTADVNITSGTLIIACGAFGSIYRNAGLGSNTIKTINIPKSCTTILYSAFRNAGGVLFNEDDGDDSYYRYFTCLVINVGDSTGSNLTSVGEEAFYYTTICWTSGFRTTDWDECEGTRYSSGAQGSIKFYGTTPPTFSTRSFYYICADDMTDCGSEWDDQWLYVPSASVNSYKTALTNAGIRVRNSSSNYCDVDVHTY